MATDWSDAPYPSGLGIHKPWSRRYVDALGAPLTGKVVLSGKVWIEFDENVIPPSPVSVELDSAGFARADLPPGEYDVREQLLSAEGQAVGREWRLIVL